MSATHAQALLLLLLAAHLAAAVYWDVKERRVPNKVVASGLLAALAFNAWQFGLPGFAAALMGAATGLLVLLPLNLLRVMGAGDVKLMAMAGAFGASIPAALWMVLYTLVAGGLLVVLYATIGRAWGRLFGNLFVMLQLGPGELDASGTGGTSRLQTAARLPYAVAIASGSLAYLLFGMA